MARRPLRTAVLACGGTGGHVYPAIAIARELLARDGAAEVTFIGRPDSYESAVLAREGFVMDGVPVGKLASVPLRERLGTLLRLPGAVLRARRVLQRRRPQVVIGTGGFVSGPAVLAAATLRMPSVVQEQNAVPGLANRVLWHLADRVGLPHDDPARRPPRFQVTGNPVRPGFAAVAPWQPREPFTLLVVGGSQGARVLTARVLDALGLLADLAPRLKVVLQSGARWAEEARTRTSSLAVPVEVHDYLHDMPQRLEAATLVIGRAGASFLAETCAAGRPSILVPFPHAAGDHQMANARALEAAGAAEVVAEPDLTPADLAKRLRRDVMAPRALQTRAEAARALARPDAAARLADLAEEVAS